MDGRIWLWRDEDYGPSSKHTGGTLKGRRRSRQLLHKMGRAEGRHEISNQVDDMKTEEAFVCSNCGEVSHESDHHGDSSECGYCIHDWEY